MTKQEIELAERRISLASKKVKPEHLEYWMCLAAARGRGYKLTEDGSRVENVWLAKEGVIPKKAGSWRFDRGQIIGDDWNEVKQFRY